MRGSRFGTVLVVFVLGLSAATTGASADVAGRDGAVVGAELQVDGPANNSTVVRHEHPDSVGGGDAPTAVERRLAGRLAGQLAGDALRIDAGEYDTARLPDEQYNRSLDMYIDAYRRAENPDLRQVEDRRELFVATATLQTRYARTLSEHRQVRREYEAAREAEEFARSQRRARELRNVSRELARIDSSLSARYRNVSATTGPPPDPDVTATPGTTDARTRSEYRRPDVVYGTFRRTDRFDRSAPAGLRRVPDPTASPSETASEAISDTTDATTRETERIVEEAYASTGVTARAEGGGSFSDPIRITGRLTAEGDGPPRGDASFLVNGRPHSATVAPDGSFRLRYRPVEAPAGTASIEVAYVPDDAALYLGSATTVTATVTQESPTVSIDNATESVRLGSLVSISGRITAGGEPVSNTSVGLALGGQRLAEARTDDDGAYRLAAEMPVNVSAGTRTLSVRAGENATALGPVDGTATVAVEETESALTLSAARSGGSVTVSGQLLTGTDAEADLTGQPISLRVDGERVRTVRTDAAGNYGANLTVPDSTADSDAVSVGAEFNGTNTSLTSTTVRASLGAPGQRGLGDRTTLAGSALVGVALLIGGGYGLRRYRRTRREATLGDDIPSPGPEGPEGMGPFAATETAPEDRPRQLDPVDSLIENGDFQEAVRALYRTVREDVGSGGASPQTHWEFFEEAADRLSAEQRSILRRLTETFEDVQFADQSPDLGEITKLRADAERFLEALDRDAAFDTPQAGETDD